LPVLELVPKLTYWIYYKSIPARSNSGNYQLPELKANDFSYF